MCRSCPRWMASTCGTPRGGRSMIVNRQGERLVAKGFVPLERHVEAFRSGRRN